jgi:hypothetical protein
MTAFIDLAGQRFGRLTALEPTRRPRADGYHAVYWLCRCDCGADVTVAARHLGNGHTRSCGCLMRETSRRSGLANTRHGRCKTLEYSSWRAMLTRCYRVDHWNYRFYGGRGIRVCNRWRSSFADFYVDMGPRPPGTTLDRIDVHGDYEPGNCRWSTWTEQRLNRQANRRCRHCGAGVELSLTGRPRRYCRPACRSAAYRARRAQRHGRCFQCQKLLPFPRTGRRRYCSATCRQIARRARRRSAPNDVTKRITKVQRRAA